MRRRYKKELYAEKIRLIKLLMPHACVGADVIVGFPGETVRRFPGNGLVHRIAGYFIPACFHLF